MNSSLWMPLLSALGAFGVSYGFFSYIGEGYIEYSFLTALLVGIGTFSLSHTEGKYHGPFMVGGMIILLLLPILLYSSFVESLDTVMALLIATLKEPYDLDISVPLHGSKASPMLVIGYISFVLSWFFLSSYLCRVGKLIIGWFILAMAAIGFYFGVNPPLLAMMLSAAYFMVLMVSFKNHGLGMPEVPTFILAMLLGGLLSLIIPESRYEQPHVLSSMQEKIVSFVDPYDPIFHAVNAYTGLLKGAKGHQTLGNTSGIHYTGRMIASMESEEQPHRLYLRSWAGGLYDKNQWKDLPDETYKSVASLFDKNQGEWYDQGAWLMEVLARNPAVTEKLLNDTQEAKLSSFKKDFILDSVYEKTHFFLLPYDADFGAPFFIYDRSPINKEGKAYHTDMWNLPSGALLAMMERESISDPYYGTYIHGEKLYRDFVYQHYLTIPDAVKEAISSLGPISKVETLSDKRQRIETIRKFLEENYTYSTHPGKTPKGKDFISYFLTENKKGYCTSFASAAVMLLRASGIPARYVVGLSINADEINEAPMSSNHLHSVDINDHHAHAWAEVYVDGLGWRPCEMTPGVEGSENPFPTLPEKMKNNEGAPNVPPDEKDASSPSSQPKETPKEEGTDSSSSPQQKRPQNHPNPSSPTGNPPQASPNDGTSTSLIGRLFQWFLILILLSLYPIYRITATPRMLHHALDSEKGFQKLLLYSHRLTHWAGLSQKGSYGEWKETLRSDKRFASFPTAIDLLIQSSYSGTPLSISEKETILSIIKETRKHCLASLNLWDTIRFRLFDRL